MGERRKHTGREVEGGVAAVPEVVLDVVAEDPQEQHVAEQVHQAAVHEHRHQEGEVHGAGSLLQRDDGRLVADLDPDRLRDVFAGSDLLGDGREGVGELLVVAHALEEHEHQHVDRNQQIRDVGRAQSSSVVVADRKYHLTPPSPVRVWSSSLLGDVLVARPPEDQHFADPVHGGRPSPLADLVADRDPVGSIGGVDLDLDEFVGRERAVHFGDQCVGQAGMPGLHDWLESVRTSFEMSALPGGQWRGHAPL